MRLWIYTWYRLFQSLITFWGDEKEMDEVKVVAMGATNENKADNRIVSVK